MGFQAKTDVLKDDISRITRLLKLQSERTELEVLFLQSWVDANSMLEGNPHKLRSAELLQVALLVFQRGHFVLYLNDFVKFGDS